MSVVRDSIDDVRQWGASDRLGAVAPVVVLLPAVGAAVRLETRAESADPPRWLDYTTALGPVIVLVGAVVGAALAWSATRRDRWWVRTQWAVDHVLGDDADAQGVGLAVLEFQVGRARSAEEAGVIGAVSDTLLAPVLAAAATDPGDRDAGRYVVHPARPRVSARAEPSAAPGARDGGSIAGVPEPVEVSPVVVGPLVVSPVERDAARLRTRVDARLGVTSSATVRAVARASPARASPD